MRRQDEADVGSPSDRLPTSKSRIHELLAVETIRSQVPLLILADLGHLHRIHPATVDLESRQACLDLAKIAGRELDVDSADILAEMVHVAVPKAATRAVISAVFRWTRRRNKAKSSAIAMAADAADATPAGKDVTNFDCPNRA